jgi:iron complex transport system ATP-binding protein
MIEIQTLSFHHPHSKESVLKGISFQANQREMTAVLGPNGSGKTTLFKCIVGLWKPQYGKIWYQDQNLLQLPYAQRAKMLATVPQEHDPPFPYSVIDVVLMGRASHVGIFSTPAKEDYLKAEEAIETAGVQHLKARAYTKISGGERQLVLIARALAQESPVLLLDEPTSHLDFRNQAIILKKVKEIMKQKSLTVLMTLHDPNLAMLFSDSAILMDAGQLVASGSPQTVITEENLKRVYGIDVTIHNWNGTRFISPRIDS